MRISKVSVQKILKELCSYLCITCDELSIYFVTSPEISKLHKEFFNDPSPTDCISFPLDSSYLGDIFICPKAALDYDPKNPYQEILLYLIHGLLHLLGYDDIEPLPRRKMRKMEKKCMDHLKRKKLQITA